MRKTVKIVPYASHDERDSIPASQGTYYAKDQRLTDCYPEVIKNAITGKVTVSLKRRGGFAALDTSGPGIPFTPTAVGSHFAGNLNQAYAATAYARSTAPLESRIYLQTQYVGLIPRNAADNDNYVRRIDQTNLNGVGISVFSVGETYSMNAIADVPTSIYYYPWTNFPGNAAFSATFSGTISSGTSTMTVSTTSSFYVGQGISGTGVAVSTRVGTIQDTSTLVLTISTSAVTTATFTQTILAKVLDADLPTNLTGGVVFLAGYMFFMTLDGKIYQTDINTISSVNPANFILADDFPDSGLGLLKQSDELIAFGTRSIQLYFISGNPTGSVLSRVANSTIDMGAKCDTAFCNVGNNKIAYISAGSTGCGLWIMSGRSPVKVSGNRQDAIFSDNLRWVLSSAYMDGQEMIFCITEDQGYGLVYCLESGAWWDVHTSSMYYALSFGDTSVMINKSLAQGFTQKFPSRGQATVNYYDAVTSTSTGTVPTMQAIVDIGDLGMYGSKGMPRLSFDMDTQSTSSCNLKVQFSDNDFSTSTSARTVDMSKERKELTRNGGFYHRAIIFSCSDNCAVRLRTVYADIVL